VAKNKRAEKKRKRKLASEGALKDVQGGRVAELVSNDEDDGYVSPEFDLPSESESDPDGHPHRSKKKHRPLLPTSDAAGGDEDEEEEQEDLEALALQKLIQRINPTR